MSLPPNPPVFKIFPPELDDCVDDFGNFIDFDPEGCPCLAGYDDFGWYDYCARDFPEAAETEEGGRS